MTETDIFPLHGPYDYPLAILWLLTAAIATHATCDLAAKIADTSDKSRVIRLSCGAFLLGLGVWSTQYIAMKVLRPSIPVSYDWPTMLIALSAAIVGSAVVLFLVSRHTISISSSLVGGIFIGGTLAAMEYVGVKAMRFSGAFDYSNLSLGLSTVLTIAASFLALRLIFSMKANAIGWNQTKLYCAIAISLIIAAMQYIWIAALSFSTAPPVVTSLQHTIDLSYLNSNGLILIMVVVIALLLATLAMDRRASQHALEIQLNEERHRMMIAITAQRVTRLENEALTGEIQERKRAEAALNHLAFHDSLTGLHNRAYFMNQLTKSLTSAQDRRNSHSAVIYIDLDNFKMANDALGHRAGDLVLREIAQRLMRCIREQDTLARMGGDEFLLLLSNLQSIEQAYRMTHRLLNVIEEPFLLAEVRFPITASIGLCEVSATYTEAEDVLRDADAAMYHAKRRGGARSVLYDVSMHEEALSALQAKLELKAAVESCQFELYYQPLVNMSDLSIRGMEALIRWNHPTRGFLGPDAFIQLAEDTGHIIAMGSWGLRRACSDFQSLQRSYTEDLILSVNVSSRQLDEEAFLTELSSAIEMSGINPRLLQLEITESIFLKDALRIGKLFEQIRNLGVRIAFDDFGTGYSSLSYLEKYPIDTLKIDQSFVQHMDKGSVNADIVQLTIKLAQAIGMSVSAEGVEEPQQAIDLLEYGCVIAQGYLYSRPISLSKMAELLAQGLASPKSRIFQEARKT